MWAQQTSFSPWKRLLRFVQVSHGKSKDVSLSSVTWICKRWCALWYKEKLLCFASKFSIKSFWIGGSPALWASYCQGSELLSDSGIVMRNINLLFLWHIMHSVYDALSSIWEVHTLLPGAFLYIYCNVEKARRMWLRPHKHQNKHNSVYTKRVVTHLDVQCFLWWQIWIVCREHSCVCANFTESACVSGFGE